MNEKSNRSNLLGAATFLTATHFLVHIYSQFLPAVLPILSLEMRLSLTDAGLLVSLPLIVQTLMYLFAGVAADKAPRVMMVAAFVSVAAGAISVTSSGNFSGLIIGFSLIALGSTFYHPPALKATSEVDPEKRSLIMGIQNAGGSLGYAAGPIVLGILTPFIGWRRAMLLWLPIIACAAIYSYAYARHIHETKSVRRAGWRPILRWDLATFIIIGASTDAAFTILTTYLTIYFTQGLGNPATTSSIIFGIGAAAGVIGSLSGGVIAERLGRGTVYTGLIALMAASALLIPITHDLPVAAIFYVCWRIFYSSTMPLTNLNVADSSPLEARSTAFGAYQVVSNLFSAAVPLLGSAAIQSLGVASIFPLSAAILGPCIIGLIWLTFKKRF